MAGVPCVNDTCSITSTVDANGRLNLTVNLDPNGGLVCTDGAGLGLAASPLSDIVTAGMPDRLDLPSPGVVQFPFSITNLTGSTILVVADARFAFTYTVDGVGATYADNYFSFDMTYNMLVDTVSVLSGGAFSDTIAGGSNPGGGSDERQFTAKTAAVFQIAPGIHSVILQTNRSAPGAGSVGTQDGTGGNNGILMDARLGVIGLPAGNIAA